MKLVKKQRQTGCHEHEITLGYIRPLGLPTVNLLRHAVLDTYDGTCNNM